MIINARNTNRPIYLSYIDLCNGLHEDILKDKTLPETVRTSLLAKLEKLEQEIEPYSA